MDMKFTKDKGCKLFFMPFIFCNIYVYLLAASKRGFKERRLAMDKMSYIKFF